MIDENAREMTAVFFSFLLKSRSAGVEVHSSASRVKAQAKRSLVAELQRGQSAESNSELASYGYLGGHFCSIAAPPIVRQ